MGRRAKLGLNLGNHPIINIPRHISSNLSDRLVRHWHTHPPLNTKNLTKKHIHHRKQGDSEPRSDTIEASYTSPQRHQPPDPASLQPFLLTYTTVTRMSPFLFIRPSRIGFWWGQRTVKEGEEEYTHLCSVFFLDFFSTSFFYPQLLIFLWSIYYFT